MARELAKKPFHERIAEQLIEQLKSGTAPWQKPWGTEGGDYLPVNAATGKRYKGVNAIALMAAGHDDQRWLTYKQAEAMGAQVRKGERGTGVIYWKFEDEQTVKDSNGKPVKNDAGETLKMKVELERPRAFYATVFNAEQIDGLPAQEARVARPFDQHARAEAIMANSGVRITAAPGDRAYYQPSTDSIRLPSRGQFTNEAGFYATALHELGHATGHATRLNRDLSGGFGSQNYAKEELRAEISSLMVGSDLGIGHDPGQHVAYVASWVKILTEQPLEIMRACSDAEKMRDYVLAWETQQTQSLDVPAAEVDIADELAALSAVANAGYDPLQSWNTLRATASLIELDATIARGGDTPDPEGSEVPYRITYATIDGQPTSITTSLYSDGKALTMVQGERVPGTGYTADADWQAGSLKTAAGIERVATREQTEALELSVYQALSIAAAKADNVAGVGASDGQCKFIAKAMAKDGLSFDDVFGSEAPGFEALTSDMAAAAVSKINSQPAPRIDAPASAQSAAPVAESVAERTYINAPYSDRREVREAGGEWDKVRKSWFIPAGVDQALFAKWQSVATPATPTVAAEPTAAERTYIAVPFAERDEAKSLGAKWDRAAKSWYAPAGSSPELLTRYSPDNERRQEPAVDPRIEFADALKALGCVVSGEHPVMDGQRHRIPTDGDKKGERSGFYIGHLDGHPAGFMMNNRTGAGGDWKSQGYRLTDEQRAQLNAEAATKLRDRQIARDARLEEVAQRVMGELATFRPATEPTPYMASKGISPQPGAYTDASGTRTLIPAFDIDGKHWTTQTIIPDGSKVFTKDSRKEGCFHVIGGQAALADAPAIVIAEGYSTAATLADALGYATVAAFDAGNLKPVAVALAAAHPDKPLIVAGDDDYRLELKTPFVNRGRVAAEEAARAAGGTHIVPVLAQADRERGLSDFNDLDMRAEDGTRGAKRQIEPHVQYQLTRKAAERGGEVSGDRQSLDDARRQERGPRAVRIRG